MQLEEEKSGRLDLQHKLHACRAAEDRLVADVCSLKSQLKYVSNQFPDASIHFSVHFSVVLLFACVSVIVEQML